MSSAKRRAEYTDHAENDFAEILLQSLIEWGEDQADRYEDEIVRAIQKLLTFPNLGRTRDDLFPGCRRHPVGQHVVYYRVRVDSILVVRILHQKMNPANRVTAPENGGPSPRE